MIKQQLSQHKAVRLSSLGTFTFNTAGEPAFVMSQEFGKDHRLKQRGAPSTDNLPTAALNLVQLAGLCDLPRDVVEKIYTKFINVLSRNIMEGRSVLLTIHRVAELIISRGELVCNFMPEATSGRSNRRGGGLIDNAPVGRSQTKAISGRVQPRGLDRNPIVGGEDPDERRRAPPPPRPRNPILEGNGTPRAGAGGGGGGAVRRNSVGTPMQRPLSAQSYRSTSTNGSRPSADTMSLLHSPRSQASYDMRARPSGAAGQRRGGGLSRENLEKHSSLAGRPPTPPARRTGSANGGGGVSVPGKGGIADARAVAAKALGVGDIVERVREKIVERGGSNGIKSLARLLAIMDDNGDKKLSRDELKYVNNYSSFSV